MRQCTSIHSNVKNSHIFFTVFIIFSICCSVLFFAPSTAQSQEIDGEQYVQLRLVPEKETIEAGDTILIAIEEKIKPDWHTYWINPGDSGASMKLTWDLPEGFEAGELQWPVPNRVPYAGLMNFGYEEHAVLFQTISAPDDLPEGPIKLTVDYEILVCHEICIPEFGTLDVTLNNGSNESHDEYIAQHYLKVPFDLPWTAIYKATDDHIVIDVNVRQPELISSPGDIILFEIYPFEWGYINNAAIQDVRVTSPHNLQIKLERGENELTGGENIDFVLAYQKKPADDTATGESTHDEGIHKEAPKKHALTLSAIADPEWLEAVQSHKPNAAGVADKADNTVNNGAVNGTAKDTAHNSGNKHSNQNDIAPSSLNIVQAMLYALFGGIILNLMPCVFPILSMKALHLSKAATEEHAHIRMHGIAYTAGILLTFGGLAGTLIALKSAGAQIGWGFQLQDPLIITALIFLFFTIGLNLSGLFEIKAGFGNVGSNLSRKKGPAGSFFTGILATIVATPCTAPFMGIAIGFALTQPSIIALCVFLMLGLGLALPFLALSFIPSLHKILPKPGAWMETFKEFLAFPIYLSVVWLVWVLSQQTGSMGVLYALAGIVGITFAIWLAKKKVHWIFIAFILAFSIIGPFSAAKVSKQVNASAPAHIKASEIAQPFTTALLNDVLENTDSPVFVNMTAAWCITCKVNERIALDTEEFSTLLQKHNIAYLKGDWTSYNEEITKFLASYGRNGVPIYVYYGAKNPDSGKRPDAVVLPQILTPAKIQDVLSNN